MKCKQCNLEMAVDWVEEKDNEEIFHNKCRNPQCTNYGYAQPTQSQEQEKEPIGFKTE
jgi:hypothetical protein